MDEIALRQAGPDDGPAIAALIDAAIDALLAPVLTREQLKASRALMGLDTQLLADGTYYVAEIGGRIAGCGGWSRRATLYGGDHTGGRAPDLLDPQTEPARIRAMYTAPAAARRGVGRAVLEASEAAARSEGFGAAQLAATLSGLPLYLDAGYQIVERFEDTSGGCPVPLVRMSKAL